jgi:hypothetical protein
VKHLLTAGNTYEETGRKLADSALQATVVAHDNTVNRKALALTESPMSGSLIAVEAFREALAGKDQTIAALEQTIHFQNILLTELRAHRDATAGMPQQSTLPTMTLWQRLDWLVRGRMIGEKERSALPNPEDPPKRLLPYQEPA